MKNPIIINQSKYLTLSQGIEDEIHEQLTELGDLFSGPVVIRDVPYSEGKHIAISCGQVWGLIDSNHNVRKYPKRTGKKHDGNAYCRSSIGKVHRVIALTFVPNDDPAIKTTVNHKDEIKYHNYVIFNDDLTLNIEKTNLEWMTLYDNNRYGDHDKQVQSSLVKYFSIQENRDKMSTIKMGTKLGPPSTEHRAKLRDALKGKPQPKELIDKGRATRERQFNFYYNDELVYTGRACSAKRKMNNRHQVWVQGEQVA